MIRRVLLFCFVVDGVITSSVSKDGIDYEKNFQRKKSVFENPIP